jgi:inner membrane protein
MNEESTTRPWQTPGGRLAIKIGMLGLMLVAFLVPLAMIRGVVNERQLRRDAVVEEIISSWGGRQTVSGPVLEVPVRITTVTDGKTQVLTDYLRIIPVTSTTRVTLHPETRNRGIFEATVYSADVSIAGSFVLAADQEVPTQREYEIEWPAARLVTGISRSAGLREPPVIAWDGTRVEPEAGTNSLGYYGQTVTAGIPGPEPGRSGNPVEHTFAVSFTINGGGSFSVLPLAGAATTEIGGGWPSPSFQGSLLPSDRSLSEEGFRAVWRSTSLGLGVPGAWLAGNDSGPVLGGLPFGVDLYRPVDHYARVERSVKYGVLFVLLPFVALFLFEVFAGIRVHPVQYLLIGAAKVVFYLLLLSVSEHLSFDWSYVIAAATTIVLIYAYAAAALARRGKGLILGGLVVAEYVFLYAALGSEDYALLIGAVGLFVVLATVMLATRRVDWYTAVPRRSAS